MIRALRHPVTNRPYKEARVLLSHWLYDCPEDSHVHRPGEITPWSLLPGCRKADGSQLPGPKRLLSSVTPDL